MALSALVMSAPASASVSLNCLGSASAKPVVQVHAIMDCAFENGSFDWCDFAFRIDDDWIDLPGTLKSVRRARLFPEVPDELTGTKVFKPPVTALKLLDEKNRTVLLLVLDKIVVTDTGPLFKGRATIDWKGHRLTEIPVTCDDPG